MNTQKLRRLSLDEVRVRGSQAFASFVERRGWSSLARMPTDQAMMPLLDPFRCGRELWSAEEFLEIFRARTESPFFAGFADREATIRELRAGWPNAETEIIERADRVVAGWFDLLGLRDLSFGDPIDWHLEPISGKRAPLRHWSRLNYLDATLTGDKKITWELNRHQYFSTLGRAYWLTGDERYAQTFVTHLSSWMDQNPPKLGVNWASSLELAFRSISWLWALYFFKESPALTSRNFMRSMKFLYLNARHIETYLSTYFSPNTHLTGEALGLFYLGLLLPEFQAASRWLETGRNILLAQLSRHVKTDGVYFEHSSYYHRYTVDFYTHFLILSRANGLPIPAEVDEKLRLLLDHLMYITRPDGTTPFFGDDDGGRLVMLDQRAANDFRAPLSTAAVLFGQTNYKYVAREAAEETLWLLGPNGLREFDKLPAQEPEKQSVSFAQGGYYVMRDGWTPTSNYLLFDCGPHGEDNCGHAHADALAFEVSAHGRTLLVDPGTYTYTGSNEMRDWFRGSLAHNTLTVDSEASSVPDGPFSWKTIARAGALTWIDSERFDYVEAKHDGYQRLPVPVTHARSILFLKHDYWVMRDCVASSGEHRYDLWFHFDSQVNARCDPESHNVIGQLADGSGLEILAFARSGKWAREEGWVSHCYGEKKKGAVCVMSAKAAKDYEFVTFLLPRVEAERLSLRIGEIETIGGRAFEVVSDNALDIVMIRKNRRVEMARMASDFDWTWARFSRDGGPLPEELVLIGGQSLELEGKEVLKSGRRIKFLVASRRGDQFRVETDEGILDLGLPIGDLEAVRFQAQNRKSKI